MRVVAMFRVSTERQANEGASLDAQERNYEELASKSEWKTLARFRGCESATKAATERHVLQQVLACIREHSPDALYVHEQSRLTRGDELEVALLLRELRDRQVKIIVCGVVRDMSSIDERFMVGIQTLVDRAETERIRERVSRGKRERARQGKKNCGPAPFGYRNPVVGDPARGILQVVPEEAAVIQRVFELAASGIGARAVADRLNDEGLRAPRGGPWGKTSITRVLGNPAYIGVHVTGAWSAEPGSRTFRFDLVADGVIMVEDAHEAIVDRETWERVHSRPRLPRTVRPRMLTGLLLINGEPAQGDSNRRKAFYRGSKLGDRRPWLEVSATDAVVWDAFVRTATDEGFVAEIVERASHDKGRERLKQVQDQQIKSAERLRRRLDALIEMRADGEISKAVFSAKADDARGKLESAEAALLGTEAALAAGDPGRVHKAVGAVRALLSGTKRLSVAQRRQVLISVVEQVDVTARKNVHWHQKRGPGGRLAEASGHRWEIEDVTLNLMVPAENDAQNLTSEALTRDSYKNTTSSCSVLLERARR